MRHNLKQLRETADEICKQADPADFDEPVNWGDIGCREAEYYENEYHCGHRVYIEEASPSAGDFCAFVCQQLKEAGYADVEAITEW